MVPGKEQPGVLLGAVVRALPPCLQAEPSGQIEALRMSGKEEESCDQWGAWEGLQECVLLRSCLAHCPFLWGLDLHGGVAFPGECALVYAHPVLEESLSGLIVSTSLGRRCEHSWEGTPSPAQDGHWP